MKPILQLRTSQHLTLTPQLQQSIKLLQLSTFELEQEIERMLVENPILERLAEGSDGSTTAPSAQERALQERQSTSTSEEHSSQTSEQEEHEGSSYEQEGELGNLSEWPASSNGTRGEDEDFDPHAQQSGSISLQAHLNEQISLSPLSDRDRALARFIIAALDEDGSLKQSLEDLLALLPTDLPEDEAFELDDLKIALCQVQSLDPPGIAARSPQECLALQLRVQPECPVRKLALRIVEEYL